MSKRRIEHRKSERDPVLLSEDLKNLHLFFKSFNGYHAEAYRKVILMMYPIIDVPGNQKLGTKGLV